MAEKEQRIWLEFDIPKPKGAVEAFRCTTMTRTEAIDRIAKKIDGAYIDENGCNKGLTIEELAEVALNALLEDK